MDAEGLLESLDRHFLAGCPELSTSQLLEHKATGTCPECRRRAARENESRSAVVTREDREHG